MNTYIRSGMNMFSLVQGDLIFQQTLKKTSLTFNQNLDFREFPRLIKIYKEGSGFIVNQVTQDDFSRNYYYETHDLDNALFHFPLLGESSDFLELLQDLKLLDKNPKLKIVQLGEAINLKKLKMIDSGYNEEDKTNYAFFSDTGMIYKRESVIGQYLTLSCSAKGIILIHDEKVLVVDVAHIRTLGREIEDILYELIKYLTAEDLHFALKAMTYALAVAGIKITSASQDGSHMYTLNGTFGDFNISPATKDLELGVNMEEHQVMIGVPDAINPSQYASLYFEGLSFKRKCSFQIAGTELCSVEFDNAIYSLLLDKDKYYMAIRSNLIIEGFHAYAEVFEFYGFNGNCLADIETVQIPLPVCLQMQSLLSLPVGALLCGKLPVELKDVMYSTCATVGSRWGEGIIVIGIPLASASNQYLSLDAFAHKDEMNLVISIHKETHYACKQLYEFLFKYLNIENPNRTGNHFDSPYICINSKIDKEFDSILSIISNPCLTEDHADLNKACQEMLCFLHHHNQLKLRDVIS